MVKKEFKKIVEWDIKPPNKQFILAYIISFIGFSVIFIGGSITGGTYAILAFLPAIFGFLGSLSYNTKYLEI